MALRTFLFAIVISFAAVPAAAQETSAPPIEVPNLDDEGGLTGSVTDDSAWQDLGIAIPAFATNREVPTPANSQGTTALGLELARVVFNDLRNNGLFRPVGPDALPRPTYAQITAPAWGTWQGRAAEMLVHGYVRANDDGRLTVGCYLYDVQLQQELVREGWVVAPAEWRRAAHKCADLVYSRLSGESPFFDSKIAYIAETGPKDNRVKRLAIMDSDGANHRFITNGQSTALTPREEEICAALGPELKRLGLIFVGIDVIGGQWLTEINVTSPTGIVAIDRFNGTDTAGRIWDAIEAKLVHD